MQHGLHGPVQIPLYKGPFQRGEHHRAMAQVDERLREALMDALAEAPDARHGWRKGLAGAGYKVGPLSSRLVKIRHLSMMVGG